MAEIILERILVPCPHCGHRQPEPRASISTFCRRCNQYFRVQEILNPPRKPAEPVFSQKRTSCFECGAELEVAVAAESTMCKRCGRYVDLKDYRITNAVSRNFKTKGEFVITPKGYVFNTEAVVGDAVIKGRFLGKLKAERSLTIYSTAEIKGTFTAGRIVIPADNHFRWPEPIRAQAIEIAGEVVADLCTQGVVILKATARLFGNLEAQRLLIEEGAVVVGAMRVGMAAVASASPPPVPITPVAPVNLEIPAPPATPVIKQVKAKRAAKPVRQAAVPEPTARRRTSRRK